ncbi:metal-dependent transcriptional regulator [Euryarchaeota archaeon]|jgi:DtxR family Mn-dependent transcriptional regulator|nr:metal-dependent transcriptional regulator [Euryarchaeota archaeon]
MDSVAVENYLKSIWELGPDDVATQDLAQLLNVAPASATKMVQRLTERGLVKHIPYKGASLTSEGRRRALSVVRRHRLLETFLAQTLDLGREQLHDEAERLEHALSTELETAIANYLGNPERDPHGHPIPGPNGELLIDEDILLSDCSLNQSLVVTQVPDRDPNLLTWLEGNGIFPGTKLKIISRDDFGGGINVSLDDSSVQIAISVASEVYVILETD